MDGDDLHSEPAPTDHAATYTWDTAATVPVPPADLATLLTEQLLFHTGPEAPDPGLFHTVVLAENLDWDTWLVNIRLQTEPILRPTGPATTTGTHPIRGFYLTSEPTRGPADPHVRKVSLFLLAVNTILRWYVMGCHVCVLLDVDDVGVPGTRLSLRNQLRCLLEGSERVTVADLTAMYHNTLARIF